MTYAEQTKAMKPRSNTGESDRQAEKQREAREAFDADLPNKS